MENQEGSVVVSGPGGERIVGPGKARALLALEGWTMVTPSTPEAVSTPEPKPEPIAPARVVDEENGDD